MVSWATKYFLKNLYNPPAPPPTYLMYAPLYKNLKEIGRIKLDNFRESVTF